MSAGRSGERSGIKPRVVLENGVDFGTAGVVGFEERQVLSWMTLVLAEGAPVRDESLDNVTAVAEELHLNDTRSNAHDQPHRSRRYHCTLTSTSAEDRGEPAPR